MSLLLAFVVSGAILLFPVRLLSQEFECPTSDSTTVYYVNGIDTEKIGAKLDLLRLRRAYHSRLVENGFENVETFNNAQFCLNYNPTEGKLPDLEESVIQKFLLGEAGSLVQILFALDPLEVAVVLAVEERVLTQHVNNYNKQRGLVVALGHSQGTLYVNRAFPRIERPDEFSAVAVASMAADVLGDEVGRYTTFFDDEAVKLVSELPGIEVLPPNVPSENCEPNPVNRKVACHSFFDVSPAALRMSGYLNIENPTSRNKILDDIIGSIAEDSSPPSAVTWSSPVCFADTPALGDDGVLFGPAALACRGPLFRAIYAIDPDAGLVKWGPASVPGCSMVAQSVSVGANGLVYTVGDWNQCQNGRLLALSQSDGSVIGDHGDCPGIGNDSPHPRHVPALDEDLNSVYFGSSSFCSVEMDRVGAGTSANNWVEPGGYYIGERGIAIDSTGNVFHATHNGAEGDGRIQAFSPAGDVLPWGVKDFSDSRPGIVGVTANDELLAQLEEGGVSYLVAWDRDGEEVWREQDVGRPVVDEDGNIYVNGLTTPRVVSFTPAFAQRWVLPLAEAASASVDLVGSDGRIYVRADNKLLAVGSSGNIAWTFEAEAFLPIGAAIDSHGHVFLQDEENTAYLLDTCLDYAASAWPKALHGNRRHTHKARDVLPRPGDCNN